jgi:hypothetical protein
MSTPTCRNYNCDKPVAVREYGEGGMPIYETMCPECVKHWDKMVLSHGAPKRVCETPIPPLFRDTDLNLLPAELASVARTWEPDGMGLLIHGSTRKGKTRTAWYIANRLWEADSFRNKYLFLTMFELEARLVAAWGKESWDRAMYKMTDVPLLFLDDMGKEKMTDRMASCLFALIDQRSVHRRPTIITTNLTGDTLLERFHDKELGAAFVARLKDDVLFKRVAAK